MRCPGQPQPTRHLRSTEASSFVKENLVPGFIAQRRTPSPPNHENELFVTAYRCVATWLQVRVVCSREHSPVSLQNSKDKDCIIIII